ncbi:MAG: hypothetical protein MHM6MM_000422 [Cercozoa sp. M6MM]
MDFLQGPCFAQTLSKALGVAIVAGSLVLKVPQILTVVAAGQAQLSWTSVLIETFGYGVTVAYNLRSGYSFDSWGEALFILLQNALLLFFVLKYQNKGVAVSFVLPLLLLALSYGLSLGVLPWTVLQTLQSCNTPIFAAARIPQIKDNFVQGHTGQLSLPTVALTFVGSLARVFTTLNKGGDFILLVGFASSAVLNGIILAQVLLLWRATANFLAQQKRKKQE